MEGAQDDPSIRSLIIARPDRVGDVIITTSCLAGVREQFPYAAIHFVAAERMRPLLQNHPALTRFISLDADLEQEFRQAKADAIVHLNPSAKVYEAAQRAGIPLRAGYPASKLEGSLTRVVEDRRAQGLMHEAEYNFDLLEIFGVRRPEKLKSHVHLPASARESLQLKLPWSLEGKRFAVIHPGAFSETVRWPMKNFMELATRVENELQLVPVFIGEPLDGEISDPRFLNLLGKTNLGELAWLMKHAAVMVGRTSGPVHLAAAVACPVVALFGGDTPERGRVRWHPLSDKSIALAKPLPRRFWEGFSGYWTRCLRAIPVEEVFAAAQQLIDRR